jgi:ribosomal protein L29
MEELRNLSVDDLKLKYHELSKEIFELANELKLTRKLEKPHRLHKAKRDRARVLTVLNQSKGARYE